MRRYAIVSVRMALVTLVFLGLVYPLAMTGLAQIAFPGKANGSVVRDANGTVVGSALVGQRFTSDRYFHGRPSESGYDGTVSGASNLAPTSRSLVSRVASEVAHARADNPGLGAVPVDMVTASGSGLDPDITIANALAQLPRVAHARGMTEAAVRRIVDRNVIPRQFSFLGEPRINVLQLNLDLDSAR
jgi:potassium-transporting ATPase KdpC subunit